MPQQTSRRIRPHDARRSNLALVLQAICDEPGRSRADVARSTGLTKVSVSELVGVLMAEGLVEESGTSDTTRPGKPSTLLTFNAAARDIIAMDLSSTRRLRGAVLTLRGEIVSTRERPLEGALGEDAVAVATALARDLAGEASHPILGLGVGTPGTVSPSGTVLRAPNLAWRNLPLAELLTDDLGLGVTVENDANAAALAERRFGGGPADLVRIQISRGVGAGVMLGGTLVRGARSDAGEIGHVVIAESGERCACGKFGCLESLVSGPALTERVASDPTRRDEVLAEAGGRLGLALAPVVGMLGLQRVIIGGPAEFVTEPLLDGARRVIVERTQSEFRPALDLSASALGQDAVLLGAAAGVLLSQLGIR